jgi:hypothetical protein
MFVFAQRSLRWAISVFPHTPSMQIFYMLQIVLNCLLFLVVSEKYPPEHSPHRTITLIYSTGFEGISRFYSGFNWHLMPIERIKLSIKEIGTYVLVWYSFRTPISLQIIP